MKRKSCHVRQPTIDHGQCIHTHKHAFQHYITKRVKKGNTIAGIPAA